MRLKVVFTSIALLGLMTSQSYAYIDPGTGSVVTTAIIGFFAAIAYTLRRYFYRVKDLFSSKKSSGRTDAGDKK